MMGRKGISSFTSMALQHKEPFKTKQLARKPSSRSLVDHKPFDILPEYASFSPSKVLSCLATSSLLS